MPVKVMTCGLSLALSVSVIEAFLVPIVVGEKLTDSVQELPAGRLAPQGLTRLNWEASVPVFAIEEKATVPLPELVTKIVWTGEVVPID